MNLNPKHVWFKVTKGVIIFIFVYYLILLILSGFMLGLALTEKIDKPDSISFTTSLYCSVFSAIIGASIFYIRKLYKACINLDIVEPKENSDKIRQIGVLFYFILRPVFAIIFSMLIIVATKSGIGLLSEGDLNSVRFFYYSIIISFFVGYSCGRFIDNMEKIKDRLAEKLTEFKI